MIISSKKQPILPTYLFLINNCHLERASFYKYLGVWISSTLYWSFFWSLHVLEPGNRSALSITNFTAMQLAQPYCSFIIIICWTTPWICSSYLGPQPTRCLWFNGESKVIQNHNLDEGLECWVTLRILLFLYLVHIFKRYQQLEWQLQMLLSAYKTSQHLKVLIVLHSVPMAKEMFCEVNKLLQIYVTKPVSRAHKNGRLE